MTVSLSQRIRRFLQRTLPALSALVLLFAALYLASNTTGSGSEFGDYYLWVFALTSVALLVLIGAIGMRLYRLVVQLRQRAPGSRLTLRMVLLFVALAVPPASIVYWFSLDFLNRSIDSWFTVDVELALNDALEIGQGVLDLQKITAQGQVRQQARRLADRSDARIRSELRGMLGETRAAELAVFSADGRVIAAASPGLTSLGPDRPRDFQLVRAARSGSYLAAEPFGDDSMEIRVLIVLPEDRVGQDSRILQAIYPVTRGFDEQAVNVRQQLDGYRRLAYLRSQLKRSFVLVLSLVLLLSVLLAVLMAFITARRVVRPISRLAEATQAIAGGDYQRRLTVETRDDLGFLVASFNTMTEEIGRASEIANQSRQEVEQRRDYLAAVLARLSSGVLSFDPDGRLLTANHAASQILGVDLVQFLDQPFIKVAQLVPRIEPLAQLINNPLLSEKGDWREELVLETGAEQQELMCRGAQLPLAGNVPAGQVLVFDDMTDLVRAQRAAAWGEVARRLAHEVKNPLTPIQLAAERLRRKFLPTMADSDAEVMDRSTRTIANQVEALKTMVDAFSDYARAPTLQLVPSQLSSLVEEVLELYRQSGQVVEVETQWMIDEPKVLADRGRIRQLLHNLVKNASEAVEGRALKLRLATGIQETGNHSWLCLQMQDNGPGLPREIINQLFEPYATTKVRGTGIGLAIVKKIAEEHGGNIQASDGQGGGAEFILRLPVDTADNKSAI
jgi:nitrogen fixation/metabolism regulation signal transduction histidine kinase